jgi:hypothetical protein
MILGDNRQRPRAFTHSQKAFDATYRLTHKFNSTGEIPWLPLLRNCSLQYWLWRDAFRFSRFRILVSSSVPRLKRHSSSLASAGFSVEGT